MDAGWDEAWKARLVETSAAWPKPRDFKPSYGTAGFRALAALLPSTVFRQACHANCSQLQSPAHAHASDLVGHAGAAC